MLKVDSLTFILLSELTIALLVIIILYLVWMLRRKSREQAAVRAFIVRLNETDQARLDGLRQRLVESLSNAKDDVLNMVLVEFKLQEKTLYGQVIDALLHRDMASLDGLDTRVKALVEPFCTLLATVKGSDEALRAQLEEARREIEEHAKRISQLRQESDQLSEQLGTALETLDEVSNEYTRIFGESKAAEELEISCKKVLNVFRQTEMRVKQAAADRLAASAAGD